MHRAAFKLLDTYFRKLSTHFHCHMPPTPSLIYTLPMPLKLRTVEETAPRACLQGASKLDLV